MPHYDYRCEDCGNEQEIFQKITEKPIEQCPKCQKNTFKRLPGGGLGLQFKGSGFYETDYKSPPKSSGGDCCPCDKSGCKK